MQPLIIMWLMSLHYVPRITLQMLTTDTSYCLELITVILRFSEHSPSKKHPFIFLNISENLHENPKVVS